MMACGGNIACILKWKWAILHLKGHPKKNKQSFNFTMKVLASLYVSSWFFLLVAYNICIS